MTIQTKYARSESTIAAILASAERLFLSRSYADVSMRDIAEQAGVTTGALYHHFSNKQALYVAMLCADFAQKEALLGAAIRPDLSATKNLRRLIRTFVQLPPAKRDLMHLVRRDVNVFRNPARNEIVRAYQAALPEIVERVIHRGIEGGELRNVNPRVLAWELVALLEVALTPYARKDLGDEATIVDHIVEMFLKGAAL